MNPEPKTPKEIAAEMLAQLNLPDDLRGRMVNLIGFPDEQSCRGYYSGRSLRVHEVACAFVKAEVRRRGGETSFTFVQSNAQTPSHERNKHPDAYNYLVPASESLYPLLSRR